MSVPCQWHSQIHLRFVQYPRVSLFHEGLCGIHHYLQSLPLVVCIDTVGDMGMSWGSGCLRIVLYRCRCMNNIFKNEKKKSKQALAFHKKKKKKKKKDSLSPKKKKKKKKRKKETSNKNNKTNNNTPIWR